MAKVDDYDLDGRYTSTADLRAREAQVASSGLAALRASNLILTFSEGGGRATPNFMQIKLGACSSQGPTSHLDKDRPEAELALRQFVSRVYADTNQICANGEATATC